MPFKIRLFTINILVICILTTAYKSSILASSIVISYSDGYNDTYIARGNYLEGYYRYRSDGSVLQIQGHIPFFMHNGFEPHIPLYDYSDPSLKSNTFLAVLSLIMHSEDESSSACFMSSYCYTIAQLDQGEQKSRIRAVCHRLMAIARKLLKRTNLQRLVHRSCHRHLYRQTIHLIQRILDRVTRIRLYLIRILRRICTEENDLRIVDLIPIIVFNCALALRRLLQREDVKMDKCFQRLKEASTNVILVIALTSRSPPYQYI